MVGFGGALAGVSRLEIGNENQSVSDDDDRGDICPRVCLRRFGSARGWSLLRTIEIEI